MCEQIVLVSCESMCGNYGQNLNFFLVSYLPLGNVMKFGLDNTGEGYILDSILYPIGVSNYP